MKKTDSGYKVGTRLEDWGVWVRKEKILDLPCVKCGGAMTSGLRDPMGDYDSWSVKPHCSVCDWSYCSDKRPLELSELLKKGIEEMFIFLLDGKEVIVSYTDSYDFEEKNPGAEWKTSFYQCQKCGCTVTYGEADFHECGEA